MTTQLPEPLLMSVFKDLIAMTPGASVRDSLFVVAKKRNVEEGEVRRVEREGLDHELRSV